MHAKLVPAIDTFLTARKRLGAGQEDLSAALDNRELALIEKTEGKSEPWHLRNLSNTAKTALNTLPVHRTPEEMKAFSTATLTYAQAVRDFDDSNKTTGKNEQTNPSQLPRRAQGIARQDREKHATQVDFANVVTQYNSVVDTINGYVKFDELSD